MSNVAEHPLLRADALEAAGGVRGRRAEVSETRHWYEQALEARRELGEADGIAEALCNLSFAFNYLTPDPAEVDVERSRQLQEEALELFPKAGNRSGSCSRRSRKGGVNGSERCRRRP